MRRAQEAAEERAAKAAEADRRIEAAKERGEAARRACEAVPLAQRVMDAKAQVAADLVRRGMDRREAERHATAAAERVARGQR